MLGGVDKCRDVAHAMNLYINVTDEQGLSCVEDDTVRVLALTVVQRCCSSIITTSAVGLYHHTKLKPIPPSSRLFHHLATSHPHNTGFRAFNACHQIKTQTRHQCAQHTSCPRANYCNCPFDRWSPLSSNHDIFTHVH